MKICVLGLRGIPDVMGGVETHCEQLYPRVKAELGSDASIWVIARRPYVASTARDFRGVQVVPIWATRNKYLEAITHTVLGVFYARFVVGADILHVHAIGPGLTIPLAKLLGTRVVFTHHGEDYRRQKWNGFARAALQAGEYLATRFADATIVVSRSLAETLAVRSGSRASRIVHIPNGATMGQAAEPDGGPGRLLEHFGLTRDGYVLAVGRLVPEKGLHDLIAAVEAGEGGRKLVIVGAADHDDAYAAGLLAKAGDRTIFTGRLRRSDIDVLYANASLFVLPSYHEGLPIAALEAIGAGAPVLLSDITPNRDLDLAEGNYFPLGDIEALARKIADPSAIPRIDRRAFLERYDWNVIAAGTAEVFRAVGAPTERRVTQ